ncbi:MAG: hypothetical protein GWN39_08200 [Thermoplasmata archaeon]|nr:hypothetical protein [Thermoplasmata archaeon]NIV78727.1 hypothetical protein [Thermoplasmata archaeon]
MPVLRSSTTTTGRARSCSNMPSGTFTVGTSWRASSIMPLSRCRTVSTIWGRSPSSTRPMSRCTALMAELAWTTPTSPTPANRMSA